MAQPEHWRLKFWLEQSLIGSFSHAELASMPREKVVCDIHCVTGWSLRDACFEGIRLSTLFRALPGLSSSGIRFVRYVAASDREHDTSTSLSLALKDGWLVDRKDGKPLSPEHGFPWRTLFPSRYFYKSLKWITQIQFLQGRPSGLLGAKHRVSLTRAAVERGTVGCHSIYFVQGMRGFQGSV